MIKSNKDYAAQKIIEWQLCNQVNIIISARNFSKKIAATYIPDFLIHISILKCSASEPFITYSYNSRNDTTLAHPSPEIIPRKIIT